jgi:hypothetical protein
VLPALRLGEGFRREADYTRRPGWSQPVESLWAIVSKWQFVNRLPYATVARCVSSLSHAGLYQGVDLRVLEAFDLHALAHFSGIEPSALCAGACAASPSSPALALASTNLRWCIACMNEGFHAALFQFTPITQCPTHNARLIQACPHCKSAIPYRLDPATAATPLACPTCTSPLVPDSTVLARAHHVAGTSKNLSDWQRLLARYASWYCNAPRLRQRVLAGDTISCADMASRTALPRDRLAFIGTLQEVLHRAPFLSSNAELRGDVTWAITPPDEPPWDASWKAPFGTQQWPHFQATAFVDLCRRFSRITHLHRERDTPNDRHATAWWRRTWQGATARPCSAQTTFDDPPFGVAEWVAFSTQPASKASRWVAHQTMALRFEEDLQLTWLAWSELLEQMPQCSSQGLHPRLIPPRGCWLDEPKFSPSSTALGS